MQTKYSRSLRRSGPPVLRSQEEDFWMKENILNADWITPEMVNDINMRLDSGLTPFVLLESSHYDKSIYSLFSKKLTSVQRNSSFDICLKSSHYKDEYSDFSKTIVYVGGEDKKKFLDQITKRETSFILTKVDYSKMLNRFFWIDDKMRLWNFQSNNSYQSMQADSHNLDNANIIQSHSKSQSGEEILAHYRRIEAEKNEKTAQEEAKTESVVQPQAEARVQKAREVIKNGKDENEAVSLKVIKSTRPQSRLPKHNSNNGENSPKTVEKRPRKRLILGYERHFYALLNRYGQSFDSLLLPMPESANEEYQRRIASNQELPPLPPLKIIKRKPRVKKVIRTPEEQREYNRQAQARCKARKDERERQYLATLTPQQQEEYLKAKREAKRKKRAEEYQRAKARKEEYMYSLSAEELEKFLAKEEQCKKEKTARNTKWKAEYRAKLKSEKDAQKDKDSSDKSASDEEEMTK